MIHVVGGLYFEVCAYPFWSHLFGSGGRAAAAIAALGTRAALSSTGDEESVAERLAVSSGFGFELGAIASGPTYRFDYLHPLWPERVIPAGRPQLRQSLRVSADHVLRFGMWEADPIVEGEFVVYDPQSNDSPSQFFDNGSRAEHLAVVCNLSEGRALSGETDPGAIAATLLRAGAEVAVIKLGPRGALVCTSKETIMVPAYRANRVFPLGSGDVFSASFAHFWMEENLPPASCADFASRATAIYCATDVFPERKSVVEGPFDVSALLANAEPA